MQTILAAIRSETLCESLTQIAGKRCNIIACGDGAQALEQLISGKPELLVLDMELPEIDGVSVLSAIRSSGCRLPVIALTACVQSTYLAQMADTFQIACVIAKPCTASAILKNALEILTCRNHDDTPCDICSEIDSMLLELNFKAGPCGYPCLVEAIRLFYTDPTQQITKSLYPEVAKICGGSPKRVERAMRSCIQNAWMNRNESIWHIFFRPGRRLERAPSNGEFIAQIAKCLVNRKMRMTDNRKCG